LQLLLQQLINGLVLGINYGLMASGLSLIFGIMRVINFAHGELYMFGAYLTVLFMNLLGLSYIWSGVISILMVVKTRSDDYISQYFCDKHYFKQCCPVNLRCKA